MRLWPTMPGCCVAARPQLDGPFRRAKNGPSQMRRPAYYYVNIITLCNTYRNVSTCNAEYITDWLLSLAVYTALIGYPSRHPKFREADCSNHISYQKFVSSQPSVSCQSLSVNHITKFSRGK